jgi:hypothetical protein
MISRPMARVTLIFVLCLLSFTSARADLGQKQAKKAIANTAGMSLPSSAVRIQRIVSSSSANAEVSTELELVFRLTRDGSNHWRVSEVRTGEAKWEDIEALTHALNIELPANKCSSPDETGRARTSDLTNQRARCLVAHLFSIPLPSDAVRVKDISKLDLGTQPSAVAVTLVQADFRLEKDRSGWQVVGFRSGNRDWTIVGSARNKLDSIKRDKTNADMNAIAAALEAFRKERGSFVISDKHSALIDSLTPRFLTRVIRLDSWQRPFHYHGERDHFTLRSFGPDGRESTADDLVLNR